MRNKYVFKRDIDDDSDGAHLESFGIEFQTEKEAKENERSPSVALLCAGLLRRDMVYELKRVLRVCDGFFAACQRHMMVQYCCGSGCTNELFCMCFFEQEANEVILNVWLYLINLECARIMELQSSLSVASGMSIQE